MFIRTALKARKIIKYENAKFPENEAIDYLKHSTSSFLSFPPIRFLSPSLFHFSLPSHIFSTVLAGYETSCVYWFQNPLSNVYLIVLLFSALRFVSSNSLNNMFSPVQNIQSVPVRSATRLPTLKLSHLSVSFLSEKLKLIKFYCWFQDHQSNMFMYRHISCTYLWTWHSFG